MDISNCLCNRFLVSLNSDYPWFCELAWLRCCLSAGICALGCPCNGALGWANSSKVRTWDNNNLPDSELKKSLQHSKRWNLLFFVFTLWQWHGFLSDFLNSLFFLLRLSSLFDFRVPQSFWEQNDVWGLKILTPRRLNCRRIAGMGDGFAIEQRLCMQSMIQTALSALTWIMFWANCELQ